MYGRIGRKALIKELPGLQEKYAPDFIVANCENITSGRGPVLQHVQAMKEVGVDVLTGGDHVFDNLKSIGEYLDDTETSLLRPANFYESHTKVPGVGYKIVQKGDKRLLVIHMIGQVFMRYNVRNPFLYIDELLGSIERSSYDVAILDFHAEASAEHYGLAFHVDGRIGLVFGTHTHIQTNDELILDGGTGVIADVGMNGPLYSVIGATYASVQDRFLSGITKGKIEQSLDPRYVVNGVCALFDDVT
ncbi:MAG: YmdB family metallophosphoesterase [Candidatus Peribacteria bacterium]|nr:MAG: YmdB family metallophosphoesterase [Candidatus Peribacteria bacterium]